MSEYAIGTEFKTGGARGQVCRVIDVWKTYNSAGELVKLRYVATHKFCGQDVADHDVVAVTIARGLLK